MNLSQWILAVGLAFLIVAPAFLLRWLTFGGAMAAFCIGAAVFGAGGWRASVPLLLFFLSSNALGRIGRNRKREIQEDFAEENRGWAQVLANGAVGTLCCLWAYYDYNPHALGAFIGAFAAANADTWATEIGILVGRNPFNIATGQPAEPGVSGAVTFQGWVAAIAGGIVVGMSGLLWHSWAAPFKFGLIGWAASLVDSLLGATLQARYFCSICGKTLEKSTCCGQCSIKVSGLKWMTNDTVNLFCTLTGAILGLFVPITIG